MADRMNPKDTPDPGLGEAATDSELGKTMAGLLNTAGGVAARLFGPKILGKDTLPSTPALSRDADEALGHASERLGRVLGALGRGLAAHPMDPMQALSEASAGRDAPVPTPEGWSPLTGGLGQLGEGLYRVTEGVLDQVAPRRPRSEGAEEGSSEAEMNQEGPEEHARAGEDGDASAAPTAAAPTAADPQRRDPFGRDPL